MKIVYIAGPYRGTSYWQQVLHIREAEAAGLEVWKRGMVALVPHLNTAHFQGELPDAVWLAGDLELMARCDAVLMVGKWDESQGAMKEYMVALEADQPVFYNLNALQEWAQKGEEAPSVED